jgi:hypothetical protein
MKKADETPTFEEMFNQAFNMGLGSGKPVKPVKFEKAATFKQLIFESHPTLSGVQAKVIYPNGYGASIILARSLIGGGSYGHEKGLYEIGVLKDDRLTYDTPIADDIIGFLTERKVTNYLKKIFEYDKEQGNKES